MLKFKSGEELPAGAASYRMKPVVKSAVRMTDDFEVETFEGVLRGHAGDWLIKGLKGELYPCRKDVFELTYERV